MMELQRVDMQAEFPVYELDGDEGDHGKLMIKSHWNQKNMVVLVIDGKEYTVSARQISEAIKRCSAP